MDCGGSVWGKSEFEGLSKQVVAAFEKSEFQGLSKQADGRASRKRKLKSLSNGSDY
jgi:hypothetical protein